MCIVNESGEYQPFLSQLLGVIYVSVPLCCWDVGVSIRCGQLKNGHVQEPRCGLVPIEQ